MKKKKCIFGGFALLLGMTLLFMSCSIDNDDDYRGGYHDIVAIVNSGDSCHFIGSNGCDYTLYPKFNNTNNIKVAAIWFKVLKDETTSSQQQFRIELLQNPVKLDATVDTAPTVAKLDSVKNDSILDLKTIYFIDGYLVMGINYSIATNLHYFTLCYASDKGLVSSGSKSIPDTLKFILRHNANNDAASSYTSEYLYQSTNKISCYCKGFDIYSIFWNACKQSGKTNIYIDIQAKVYDIISRKCKIIHTGINPVYYD